MKEDIPLDILNRAGVIELAIVTGKWSELVECSKRYLYINPPDRTSAIDTYITSGGKLC